MEIKNKIIDEIQKLLSDYEIVSKEFTNSNPKSIEDVKALENPGGKIKKIRMSAVVALKLRLFTKIYALDNILKEYFTTDLSNTYPEALSAELKEYAKVNAMIDVKDGKVDFGKEFEQYLAEFEDNLKKLQSGN